MIGDFAAAVETGLARHAGRTLPAEEELRGALDVAARELDSDPSVWEWRGEIAVSKLNTIRTFSGPHCVANRPAPSVHIVVGGRPIGLLQRTEGGWRAATSGTRWSPPMPTAARALALLLAAPVGALAARAAEVDAWRVQDARITAARGHGQVEVVASAVAVLFGAGAIACVQTFGWLAEGQADAGVGVGLLYLAGMFALCALHARSSRRALSRRPRP